MTDEYYDGNDKVLCQICKEGFGRITPAHLKKAHEMTSANYRLKFPFAPMSSKKSIVRMKMQNVNLATFDKDTKPPVIDDQSKPETSPMLSLRDQIVELAKIKESKMKKEKSKVKKQHDGKEEILMFLKTIYPNIENNYLIEKTILSGHLEYSIITDIADPISKTDFEFTNAFWHNEDRFIDFSRDSKLINDGWTIIKIDNPRPTIDDVSKHIDFISN